MTVSDSSNQCTNFNPFWSFNDLKIDNVDQETFDNLIMVFESIDPIDKDKQPLKALFLECKPKVVKPTRSSDWKPIKDNVYQVSKSPKDFVSTYNLFTDVIHAGNEVGLWNIKCDPGRAFIAAKPTPSYHPPIFEKLMLLQGFDLARSSVIDKSWPLDTLVGFLLAELIGSARVLSVQALRETVLAVLKSKVLYGASLCWTDVYISCGSIQGKESKRIYLSDRAVVCLSNFNDNQKNEVISVLESDEASKDIVGNYLRCFLTLADAGLDSTLKPKKLIELTSGDLDLKSPAFISASLTRKYHSHALEPNTQRRILGLECVVDVKDCEASDLVDQYDLFECIETKSSNDKLTEFYQVLRGSKSKKLAVRNLVKWNEKYKVKPYIFELISDYFGDSLHEDGEYFKHKMDKVVANAYRMLPDLVPLLSGVSKQGMKNIDLEDVYREVISSASPGARPRLAKLLKGFQGYLERKSLVGDVNPKTFKYTRSMAKVDAKIISFDEYERIREAIERDNHVMLSDRYKSVLKILLSLGFFAGLRRTEGLNISLDNLIGERQLMLDVCETWRARLKNISAKRKLPLHLLLPDRELNELRDWRDNRQEEDRGNDCIGHLLAIPREQRESFKEYEVFKLLHHYMRKVTGDNNIRFHHLRHSFATWSALRFTSGDVIAKLGCFDRSPKTKEALTGAPKWAGLVRGHADNTRADLFRIARYMGHSHPRVTLEHYIHSIDLISLGYSSRWNPPIKVLKDQLIEGDERFKSSTVYKNKTDLDSLKPSYLLRKCPDVFNKLNWRDEKSKHAKPYVYGLSEVLYMHHVTSSPVKEISRRSNMSTGRTNRIIEMNDYLYFSRLKSKVKKYQSKRTGQNYPICYKPIKKDDIKVFDLVMKRSNALCLDDLDDLLKHYFKFVRVSGERLQFKSTEDARRWIDLVRAMGFKKADLNFSLHPTGAKSITKAKRYWAWGLQPVSKIQIPCRVKIDHRGVNGCLNVKLESGDGQASVGFRYAMQHLLLGRMVDLGKDYLNDLVAAC